MSTQTLPRSGRGSFATEIGASTRAGLSAGLTLGTDPAYGAEIAYRREQALVQAARQQRRHERAARRAVRRSHAGSADGTGAGRVTRWTSWLPSVPRHRSSAAAHN